MEWMVIIEVIYIKKSLFNKIRMENRKLVSRKNNDYELVTYKNKKYYVCRYSRSKDNKLFVIDAEDGPKVINHSWYWINGYVARKIMNKRKVSTEYLHNIIKYKPKDYDTDEKMYVNHISRNSHDNRRINLRLLPKSAKNENKKDRDRKVQLPDDCNINIYDIPKCVYLCKEQDITKANSHGARFVLDLKKNGKSRRWYSSSLRDVSLEDKLIEIKQTIMNISKEYPELIKYRNIIEKYSDEYITLTKDFNEIIKLSKFDCVKDNLKPVPKKNFLEVNLDNASTSMKKYLTNTNTAIKTGKQHINRMSDNCIITNDMIPANCYCHYHPGKGNRGDQFIIDYRPKGGERMIKKTTGSTLICTEFKYFELLNLLLTHKFIKENAYNTFMKPLIQHNFVIKKNNEKNKCKYVFLDARKKKVKAVVNNKNENNELVNKKPIKKLVKKPMSKNIKSTNSDISYSDTSESDNRKSENTISKQKKNISSDSELEDYIPKYKKSVKHKLKTNKKSISGSKSSKKLISGSKSSKLLTNKSKSNNSSKTNNPSINGFKSKKIESTTSKSSKYK